MDESGRQRWLVTVLIVAVIYVAASIESAVLAGAAASIPARNLWRLSAFIVAGLVFAAHIAHEHFWLRSTATSTAWHTAVAAATGGLGIALAANVHDLGSTTGYRPRMLVALLAWPLLTGVPAFLLALAVAAGLEATRRSRSSSRSHE